MKTKTENELIEKLLDITYTIVDIYNKLIKYDYQENYCQYEEWQENLMMCIEVENEIYEIIFKKNPKKDLSRIVEKVFYLNNKRNKPIILKELAPSRIATYLESKNYLNPFLSMEKENILREQENGTAISVQYNLDYIYKLIETLEQKINITNKKKVKKSLITTKYHIIIVNKLYELSLLRKPIIIPTTTGKERALLFGQDENLVYSIYQELCLYQLNNSLNELLCFEEKGEKLSEDIKIISLINIECSLSFLTPEELKQSQKQIYSQLEKYEIINDIEQIINKLQSNYQTKGKSLINT